MRGDEPLARRGMATSLRTKSVEQSIADTDEPETRLRKDLSWWDLTVFGVSVVVGAGIFTITASTAGGSGSWSGWRSASSSTSRTGAVTPCSPAGWPRRRRAESESASPVLYKICICV
jgi:hypothetical protein